MDNICKHFTLIRLEDYKEKRGHEPSRPFIHAAFSLFRLWQGMQELNPHRRFWRPLFNLFSIAYDACHILTLGNRAYRDRSVCAQNVPIIKNRTV